MTRPLPCILQDLHAIRMGVQGPNWSTLCNLCFSAQPLWSSCSISMVCSGRLPLSVVNPTTASATFCVWASSLSTRTLKETSQLKWNEEVFAHQPSFMVLSLTMCKQIVLSFEPFCTLGAVPFSQTRQIFSGFGGSVSSEMLPRGKVGFDLVEISISDIRNRAGQMGEVGATWFCVSSCFA